MDLSAVSSLRRAAASAAVPASARAGVAMTLARTRPPPATGLNRPHAHIQQEDQAADDQPNQHDECAYWRKQIAQDRRQAVAERSTTRTELSRPVTRAPHEVDQAESGDEYDETAEDRQRRSVTQLGGSLDNDAGDDQQDGQQPGALPDCRASRPSTYLLNTPASGNSSAMTVTAPITISVRPMSERAT